MKHNLKKTFGALIAAATLTLSPSFADAAKKHPVPAHRTIPQKTKTVVPVKKTIKPAPAPVVIAPEPKPAPRPRTNFVPVSANGETCPDSNDRDRPQWQNPSFDVPAKEQQQLLAQLEFPIGRNKPDGFFTERSTQSINDLRLLSGMTGFHESMSDSDARGIRALAASVKQDIIRNRLDAETAIALRLASNRTGLAFGVLLDNARGGFTGSNNDWIALVKHHGDKYGLSHYARKIDADNNVSDPLTLEQILSLRRHPRLSVILQAEFILHQGASNGVAPSLSPVPDTQIRYLKTLGFETDGATGQMTAAALKEFGPLYTPAIGFFGTIAIDPAKSQETYLRMFAEQAQKDAATYKISTAAAAAIRLANIRTGADFGYMMELSSAESSFDHEAKAATSSATGLYQFTEDTWLHMVGRYGRKYGLGDYADMVEAKGNMYGILVARVENPFVRTALLDLRRDPHLAALLSAEFQMRNKFIVECSVGHALNRTEQYLGHFLGSLGAGRFLNQMAEAPGTDAAKMFATAAAANKSIFFKRDAKGKPQPRNLREVYGVLDRKFETGSYEDQGFKITPVQGEEPDVDSPEQTNAPSPPRY